MGISISLWCSGCCAGVENIHLLRGKSMAEVAPDGWVVRDPWTDCTYCPQCWQSILDDVEADRAARPPSPSPHPQRTKEAAR